MCVASENLSNKLKVDVINKSFASHASRNIKSLRAGSSYSSRAKGL